MENESSCLTGRSCCLAGCLTMVALCVLGIALGGITLKKLYNQAMGYLDDAPAAFATPVAEEGQMQVAQQKVAGFQKALEAGTAGSFSFAEEDLNALLAAAADNPDSREFFEQWQGKCRFGLADDGLRVRFSVALDEAAKDHPQLKGKFLNLEARCQLEKAEGLTGIYLRDVKVGGQALPQWLNAELEKKNLADELLKDPNNHEFQDLVNRIGRLVVRDGRLEVDLKAGKPFVPKKKSTP